MQGEYLDDLPRLRELEVVEKTTPKGLMLVASLLCNGSGIVDCWEGERIDDALTRSIPEQIPGLPNSPIPSFWYR